MKLFPLYLFFILAFSINSLLGQGLPKSLPVEKPGLQGLTGKLPMGEGLGALSGKPEIPYLEELKQIQSLRKSYESLKNELNEIKGLVQDSTQRDSLILVAKEQGRIILEKEAQVLKSLIESEDIPGGEIRNAASMTLERVKQSQASLAKIKDFEGLEALLDQNEENLKALTNEWIMPKVEQVLTGTLTEYWDPAQAKIPDFYGKGALEKLVKEGVPADLSFDQAKSMAKEKALHLSDTYVQEFKGKFSKLKFDSLGNIEVIQEAMTKPKFDLWEENELKDAGFLERLGLYAWYDPLTSFGEGVYADAGLSYRFTHQLEAFGGIVFRRDFEDSKELTRTGQGAKLSVRFAKGNWFVKTELARVNIEVNYPVGFDDMDYEGMEWNTGLGFGRVIPIGKRIQSVVLTSWNPAYNESKSLSNSPFQLKIGFELKGLKIGRMKEIDLKEYKDKVPTDKIQQKLDNQTEVLSPDFL
ncbi:hypothetical protein [Algoriphagus sp. A40]|uniref:hypothetical protein n=1 Tax=Algoriphagus sp. A40 TaxID=1945863 RepID=UPI00098778B5|nr:hypothetical protein [Algoriphagus sp. A40]OOG76427.1 hypothetical protein B0E43_08020 [Algoriphagus sp. A40]